MLLKIFLMITVVLALLSFDAEAREPFYGTIRKVIDGDSLLIDAGGTHVEVRLYGIDSPEYNQPFADEAKKYITHLTGWRRVLVMPDYVDSYGRTVASIMIGDQVLNKELVEAGYAWVYPRYCRKEVCKSWKELEDSARAGKKGLWCDPKPVPPWIWKRR